MLVYLVILFIHSFMLDRTPAPSQGSLSENAVGDFGSEKSGVGYCGVIGTSGVLGGRLIVVAWTVTMVAPLLAPLVASEVRLTEMPEEDAKQTVNPAIRANARTPPTAITATLPPLRPASVEPRP